MKKLTWLVIFTSHLLFCSDSPGYLLFSDSNSSDRLFDSDNESTNTDISISASENLFDWGDNFIFDAIDAKDIEKLNSQLEVHPAKTTIVNSLYTISKDNKTIKLSPLEFAISQYAHSRNDLKEIVDTLKTHGLDLYATNQDECSPLKLALKPLNYLYKTTPDINTVKYIVEELKQNVNENEKEASNLMPLDLFLSYITEDNEISEMKTLQIFAYLAYKGAKSNDFQKKLEKIDDKSLKEKLKIIYDSYQATEARRLWDDHNQIN